MTIGVVKKAGYGFEICTLVFLSEIPATHHFLNASPNMDAGDVR